MTELNFLTEEQINAEHEADIIKQEKDNSENDYDYPNQMNRYLRKWQCKIRDAKPYWNIIKKLSDSRFASLVEMLCSTDEPVNPNGGRPRAEVELARVTRYNMSAKQRAVVYKLVNDRYNAQAIAALAVED